MNKNAQSSFTILSNIRFFCLATSHPETNAVWTAPLLYIPRYNPLRLIWYSKSETRHSRGLSVDPRASGSIFSGRLNQDVFEDVAGAQFSGLAREIAYTELQDTYDYYHSRVFPDPDIRKKNARHISEFYGLGTRRFYELEVEEWWLYAFDGDDGRIFVPLNELARPPKDQ
ncbi:hypothetical protein [Xenorhabdus innexi]|uniref:Pyridoxamine 5'-phosphate oxidase N-terminal domain-containing protein n=1 Tax=Xenorhabdus innexi TaxID=290109 RepID=A0A1N6MRC6_9GAMM|nr:hypothetical protein [Xenorhabdus innexi]PHM33161.1 hypothetical protein Xinn_02689 [Xenorhabdus innexi]SIP71385.1 conserved hypothetical protein [Xenorhabdus innexi]